MPVRNCAEMGENLQKIIQRLTANQDLCKLLYYTDFDPLNQPDLSEETIQKEVFGKLVKFVPSPRTKETANSIISVYVNKGLKIDTNEEFRMVDIVVVSYVPFTQWKIKDPTFRPFKIMGEVEKSLDGKTINGLGKIHDNGFTLIDMTDEISVYEQLFTITTYY